MCLAASSRDSRLNLNLSVLERQIFSPSILNRNTACLLSSGLFFPPKLEKLKSLICRAVLLARTGEKRVMEHHLPHWQKGFI